MRAALCLAALLAAAPAVADPRAPSPHPKKPARTIVIELDRRPPVIVDGKQLPRTPLAPLTRTPPTPPPRCKQDRRGATHCTVTY